MSVNICLKEQIKDLSKHEAKPKEKNKYEFWSVKFLSSGNVKEWARILNIFPYV